MIHIIKLNYIYMHVVWFWIVIGKISVNKKGIGVILSCEAVGADFHG